MSDAQIPPAAAQLPRWMRWLLVGSLTLNLLVVGIAVGAAVRFSGTGASPPVVRSLGFGAWSGGLERSDLRALRKASEERGLNLRALWREERQDRAALVAALKADPFDPATLDAVAERMAARNRDRLDAGHALIRAHVLAMTEAERLAFADRLERSLRKGGRDGSDR